MRSGHLICKFRLGRILLVLLTTLFTICAGVIGPANSASDSRSVTIVLEAEPPTLDPGNSCMAEGKLLIKNILEPLTELNPDDSRITPGLATSWKPIDASTWRFFLRKGVKFHDGKDFNAEAVIFNIKRIYDKRIDSKTRAKFFSHLKIDAKALDNYTVELKTDKPEPLLPTLMATLMLCSPNTPPDKITRQPIGTGPYKFAKWDAGMQIVLESFDGYWGKQPQVKKAVYVWRSESSLRAAMVETDEADLAPDIAVQDAKRPDMDYNYFNAQTVFLRLIGTSGEPPLNDRRVRMALNYAINRGAIRGSILSKEVVPATQMIVPSIFGYNPDLKVWPYDPQKAKQLIAEARKDGVPVDKEILIVGRIGYYPGGDEVMEAVTNMYRAVGLNVKLKMVEQGVFVSTYQFRPYPKIPYILQNGHDNNSGDAVFTVFPKYHCDGKGSPICDKKLDDLIEKAQLASGEERRSLWRAVFKRIHEEIICDVMLFHLMGYSRVGKRINFKPSLATNSEIPLALITFK